MKHIFVFVILLYFISIPLAMADDLGRLLEIWERQQQRDLQAQEQLGETIGNIMQQRGQRAFERHAFEFFGTEPITHEKISQFSSMYPNMPLSEIYRIAGQIQDFNRRFNK